MPAEPGLRSAGLAAVAGGLLGLAVTPLLVMVKYATGWSIVPEPAWVGAARTALAPLISFATPVQLWIGYGSIYTFALLLMLTGVLALRGRLPAGTSAPTSWRVALWALLLGLTMVIVGDAIHTASWHRGGATVPLANLNPIASLGISVEYLGIPIVFVASLVLGALSLRRLLLPPVVSVLLLATGPGGILLTVTQLPAMPSGPFAVFSLMMVALGATLAAGRGGARRLAAD